MRDKSYEALKAKILAEGGWEAVPGFLVGADGCWHIHAERWLERIGLAGTTANVACLKELIKEQLSEVRPGTKIQICRISEADPSQN